MTAWDVRELLLDAGVLVTHDGDKLVLQHWEGGGIPPALVDLAREHKPALLRLLRFEKRADALLLAVFGRLAREWPPRMPIHRPDHDSHEVELAAAYRGQDIGAAVSVLRRWESTATDAISEHVANLRGTRADAVGNLGDACKQH